MSELDASRASVVKNLCRVKANSPGKNEDGWKRAERRSAGLALASLIAVLSLDVPLFLHMPLWSDVSLYDLCARNVLEGGVPYRDVFDVNLPGIVWVHIAVRSLMGWSSEAIRLVDLAVVSTIVWLLARWLRSMSRPRVVRLWATVALFGFYLSTTEYAHCQRDTWALLPALLALNLRLRQTERLSAGEPPVQGIFVFALFEAILWSAALWIKPFVVVPAAFCWLLTAIDAARLSPATRRVLGADAGGLLVGGLLAGAAGIGWLWSSGAWPHFLEVFVSWNPSYYDAFSLRSFGLRTLKLLIQFPPWSAIHLIALPIALSSLIRHAKPPSRQGTMTGCGSNRGHNVLLAAFYVGWVLQSSYLQKGLLYHHVPAVLVAFGLVGGWSFAWSRSAVGRVCLVVFAGLAVVLHPVLRGDRLRTWPRCLTLTGSVELKDRLALTDVTDWRKLDHVAEFLDSQAVADGDFLCLSPFTIPLYLQLNLRPPTRYLYFNVLLKVFPERHEAIWADVRRGKPRFMITDLRDPYTSNLTPEQAEVERPGNPLALPPGFPDAKARSYPWTEPIVFRAGRYFVHRVRAGPGSS